MAVEVESVVLNVITESVRRYVNEEDLVFSNLSLDTMVDSVSRDMVLTLTRRRATENLGTVSFNVHADWFQGFKEKFFPKFLLNKFPVRYDIIEVSAKAFYDNLTIPEQTTEIKLQVLKGKEFIN